MANVKVQASRQRPADGMVQLLVRVDITRTNRPRLKSGIWAMPHHFVDGAIKIPRSGKLNTAETELAKDTARLLAAYISRIENILAVSKSHLDIIEKDWLESVIELDKAGRIPHVPGENPFTWANIDKAARESAAIVDTCANGLADIYSQIKTYCVEKRISSSRRVAYYALGRTIYRYTQFVRHTETNRNKFVFDVATITKDDIAGFIDYARHEGDLAEENPKFFEEIKMEATSIIEETKVKRANLSAKNRSDNTLVVLFSMLRSIIKWLVSEKQYTSNDPLAGYESAKEHYIERPIYLTIEERDKLYDFDFSNRPALDLARDVFMLQCLTGCRYNDLASLTNANVEQKIETDKDTKKSVERYYLSYIPSKTIHQKTVVKPRIPLNGRALAILEKYKGIDKDGRLLPFNGINGFNTTLKKVFKAAGLDRNVQILNRTTGEKESKPLSEIATSHMARRTFCGNLYKKVKDPNLIGKMSGHVPGSNAFARYRDIDDEDLRDAISLID